MLKKLLNKLGRKDHFRVTAITIARNEGLFIGRHIEHLKAQGIEVCLIDNESVDDTLKIAEKYLGKGLLKIVHLPYPGQFNLDDVLKKAEEVADETDSDWFIFTNPDEFPFPVKPFNTLNEAFRELEKKGFNSVNFDEFVFLPEKDEISYEGRDFINEMKYYYFFDPSPLHRVIAWKKAPETDLRTHAGHKVSIPDQKIFPVNFTFKHYVFLSKKHAVAKYGNRLFSKTGLNKGWHGTRAAYTVDRIDLPPAENLKMVREGEECDRSDPQKKHMFFKQGDYFSKYKKKYILGKRNSNDGSLTEGNSGNYPPIPFIIGFPGPGINVIRLLLEKILSFKFAENNRLFESIFTGDPVDSAETVRLYYRQFAESMQCENPGDASPGNHIWIAGIQDLLPEAHFIHVIEDGRRLLAFKKSSGSFGFPDMEKISTDWLISVTEVRQQSQFCRHFLEIKMEDFNNDPLSKAKEILAFLDSDRNSQEITSFPDNDFNKYWKHVYADSYYGHPDPEQPDQSTDADSTGFPPLTPDEISYFESIAGLTLYDLGYRLSGKQ
jgi:glycosyltransferase involved in cell wall biosynthesis